MKKLKHDGKVYFAEGASADSKKWVNKEVMWSELTQRLITERKTSETLSEFLAFSKGDQGKIKDVGGYVGGYLRGSRRKKDTVVNRSLLTLDLDFADLDFWEDFTLMYGCAAVVHGTHKHSDKTPRYRLVVPLSREVLPDEYEAVSRKFAGELGIELFDSTTFQASRLMFWPSNPKDVEYYARRQDGKWLDPDKLLESYKDWADCSLWPRHAGEEEKVSRLQDKQIDPSTKRGVVGAFCRTYTISTAISSFLEDKYIPGVEDRYTYVGGSTSSGLVVYDDTFAYSHHGTDPCSGKLCNAFDLVRIHKYGMLDDGPGKPKSMTAMEELIRSDKETRKTIASETVDSAKYDFKEDTPEAEKNEDINIDWMESLEVDNKGAYLSSSNNINLILKHDQRLNDRFKQNDFDNKRYVEGTLPWRKIEDLETLRDVDYCGVRNYIESIYGVVGKLKIEDALALEFEKQSFHPVREYLSDLKWDGVKRIDTILVDYFGAEDTAYTREALRKTLCGGVARVFQPGIKFDLVLTLVSSMQGTGKSSFFRALGRDWFSDSFIGVSGKESFEQLQGAWVIEMAELKGLRNAEVEAVKHFISKQEDIFRPAYARITETFKRQCVFVASTNENEFLKDPSGNRRFMPVSIEGKKLTENKALKQLIEDDDEITQLWAEAVVLYKNHEPLYLSQEAESIADLEQKKHSEQDERTGIIEQFINTPLPKEWGTKNLFERRQFLANDELTPEGTQKRQHVCIAEIWCECLQKPQADMDRYKTRELNNALKTIEGWEQQSSTKTFPLYGKQRYYARKLD